MNDDQFSTFMNKFMDMMASTHQTNTDLAARIDNGIATFQTSGQATPVANDMTRGTSPSVMANLASRIQSFEYNSDDGYQFSKWYDRHEGILNTDASLLDDGGRVRLLLEKLSDDCFEKYKRQILPKKCCEATFRETVDTLKDMFDTKVSMHTTRFQCLNLKQHTGEDLLTYTGRVNQQCEKSALHDLGNEGLKCLLWICGLQTKEPKLRASLLGYLDKQAASNIEPKLHDLYKECDRILALNETARIINGNRSTEVNEVSLPEKFIRSANHTCFNCGKPKHRSTECRGPKAKCSKCSRFGHLDKFCRSTNKRRQSRMRVQANIGMISVESTDTLPTHTTEVNAVRRYATLSVDGTFVEFQIDSGADVTLINSTDWERMGRPPLQTADVSVKHAGGTHMNILGYGECNFIFHGLPVSGRYYVTPGKNLLGLEWLDQNHITRNHLDAMVPSVYAVSQDDLASRLKKEYPAVFTPGLGLCTKEKAKLVLVNNSQPKFRPKRPVPHAALEAVDKELDRLQSMGVIEPVTHSLWSAPIVVVRKPGKTRVCADFSTGLNTSLVDVEYPLPVIEDIFATLNGGKIFSQIDFSDAYLQIELDNDSKDLVVINTHRGLFRYNRLPFGIKTAPALFQSIMNKLCNGLQGVTSYLDDVIVVGSTQEEHDQNILPLFDRIDEYGFKVRLDKCTFRETQINFLGYVVDANRRRPNPDKIRAIIDMKEPTDVPQVRSFLRMVTHYGNFLPGLKEMRGPLDMLLQKQVDWTWGQPQQRAFDSLKSTLSSDLNLTHYDPKVPLVVAADASSYGIGAVISHRFNNGTEKPIAHVSRSLTAAEKNYSQTEKEGLALIFAVKKFHKYIYGRHFLLRTDHKPLLAIFGLKNGVPVHSANRLIRWSLILTAYDFNIEYVCTTDFGAADGISRLMKRSAKADDDEIVIAAVEFDIQALFNENVRRLPITADDIRVETARDPTLRYVLKHVRSGRWPNKLEDHLKQFANRRDSLSIVHECLMDGDRVVIPNSLRKAVLLEVHRGHPGIVCMKSLARSHAYWPGMDKECEHLVKSCQRCLDSQKSPQKAPLRPWPDPTRVWQRVHIDYAGPVEGLYYLVVVDAKAKWPEIFITKEISATVTVNILNRLFSQYGYPDVIVSDNGTQFTSELFSNMCSENGIEHMRIAPHHLQSNGQAERFVDTLKRGLRKLKGGGKAVSENSGRVPAFVS